MEAVTYSLKLDKMDSEEYYRDADYLTDEFLEFAAKKLSPFVNQYKEYLIKFKLEDLRENEEYFLELLSFGILWRTYAGTALAVRFAPFIILSKMGEWRKKHQHIKPFIDFSRGILIALFLLPKSKEKNISVIPSLGQIDRVCLWFEATGEFREQALRFIRWRAFLQTLSFPKQVEMFYAIANSVNWFESRSIEVLGKYTENVNGFIQKEKKKYQWREDRISCLRSRIEYHLNMVGACLMNRAFLNDFAATDSTALLLPGCMRARANAECKAFREERGLKCAGCEPKCRVNQLRLTGLKKDFEVYVIPHASDLSLWSNKRGEKRKGIVASACVTTLVEGGWELKRYGVPAQCVLLEYCGCKKHWHSEGITTEINKRELDRIISKNVS